MLSVCSTACASDGCVVLVYRLLGLLLVRTCVLFRPCTRLDVSPYLLATLASTEPASRVHAFCARTHAQIQRNVEQATVVEALQKRLSAREQDLQMLQELIEQRDVLMRGRAAPAVDPASAAAAGPLLDTALASEIDSYFAADGQPSAAGGGGGSEEVEGGKTQKWGHSRS